MKSFATSPGRIAVVVASAAMIGSLLLAGPAHAGTAPVAEGSAPGLVGRAERFIGLNDDSQPGAVKVLGAGDVETIRAVGDAPAVTVTVDPGDEAVYTADALTETSTRFAAIFSSKSSNSATWDLGAGTELYALSDGRVSVGDDEGNLLAGIEAPWAIDGVGHRVSTYYTVDGSKLTQHVQYTADTVFPVVADPTITSFPGYWTVKFNRKESVTVTSTVAACAALLSKSPVPALKALMVGCATFAAYGAPQLGTGKCLRVHILGAPPVFATWWPTWPKC